MRAALFAAFSLFQTLPATAGDPDSYNVTGVVRRVDKSTGRVFIRHDPIPGYMEAMLMPFTCRNGGELEALSPGDRVTFLLHVGKTEDWIDRIQVLQKTAPAVAASLPSVASPSPVNIGGRMPGFVLQDEHGRPLTLAHFKGCAFAITFMFTRCPLPSQCPLLTQKFKQVQDSVGSAGCKLLSVSIDSLHDTPEALRRYARAAGAKPEVWSFATGTPAEIAKLAAALGADFWEEQGVLSHHLRTVVVGSDSTIQAVYEGNGWAPEGLSEVLKADPVQSGDRR